MLEKEKDRERETKTKEVNGRRETDGHAAACRSKRD
jgi:hypothetical protein